FGGGMSNNNYYQSPRLRITSPCIDSGDNALVPAGVTTDLAGNPRFVDMLGVNDPGAIVDMGAHEDALPLVASGGRFVFDARVPSVQFGFNGDLSAASVQASDLTLMNLTTGQPIDTAALAAASYDPSTRSATWAFAGALPDGNYHATLAAATVADPAGG